MTEIKCKNLSFTYPNSEKRILNRCSLTNKDGQTVSLVGLNGSGKTTLLKLMSGILTPSQGEIFYDNNKVTGTNKSKLYLNFLPENAKLFLLGPTVLNEFLHVFDTPNEVRLFLASYNLESLINKRIYHLSERQRRLIDILSALIQKKRIFLLDEPTIGLDSIGRKFLFEII